MRHPPKPASSSLPTRRPRPGRSSERCASARLPARRGSSCERLLADALPLLEKAAGVEIEGGVASSPNAYDDIVEELNTRDYDEIILETLPSHVSHWLHVDLPQRVAHLGYPLTTVPATQ
jgi:hypothetical protein